MLTCFTLLIFWMRKVRPHRGLSRSVLLTQCDKNWAAGWSPPPVPAVAALLASLLRDQGWAELRDGRPLQLRPSPFNRMLVVAGTFSASFILNVWGLGRYFLVRMVPIKQKCS